MAKTRQQRKAEKRAREQQAVQQRQEDSQAAERTQVPRTAEVVEAEIVLESGMSEEELKAPAPSRADTPKPAKKPPPPPPAKKQAPVERERDRNAVAAFFASCWAELKRVQWPDRNAVGQATAVTLVFVAVAAAYLGALDAMFNWLIKQIL